MDRQFAFWTAVYGLYVISSLRCSNDQDTCRKFDSIVRCRLHIPELGRVRWLDLEIGSFNDGGCETVDPILRCITGKIRYQRRIRSPLSYAPNIRIKNLREALYQIFILMTLIPKDFNISLVECHCFKFQRCVSCHHLWNLLSNLSFNRKLIN